MYSLSAWPRSAHFICRATRRVWKAIASRGLQPWNLGRRWQPSPARLVKPKRNLLAPILRNPTNKAFFNSCRHLQSAIKPRCSTASGFPAAAVSNLDLAQRQLTIPRIRIAKKTKTHRLAEPFEKADISYAKNFETKTKGFIYSIIFGSI